MRWEGSRSPAVGCRGRAGAVDGTMWSVKDEFVDVVDDIEDQDGAYDRGA